MAETINISELNPSTFEFQEYSSQDTSLISSINQTTQFNPSTDYIEYFVYNLDGTLVYSNTSGYPNYTLLDNQISIDPSNNLKSSGIDEGTYNTLYNFLSKKLGSSSSTRYYISEISSDRTEIRIESTSLTEEEVINYTNEFITELSSDKVAYPDFYLNFDNNQLVIANNIQLDGNTVLIKLYEALPSSFGLKSELWVVEKIAEPKAYSIDIFQTFELEDNNIYIQGPNLNIDYKDQINNSTDYNNYSSLTSTTSAQGSGSLKYQINSLLAERGIDINVDYTNYTNFIHFSSAQTRLENFYYKLSLIEQYQQSASYSDNTNTNYYVSSSNVVWQNKIDDIITNFDEYEYYLYYESGSQAWPKTNSTPPYINEPTTIGGTGYNWFVTQSLVAEEFDQENNNALIYAIPEYLREDSDNQDFELFVEMIGQHFDSIWIYLKDVTSKFDADNRINYGISKDLVAQAIRDLGVKIYQNNFSTDDLYTALLGITPSGSLLGLPNTTDSLPTPTGLEYIDTYITASETGSMPPLDDVNKEIYKRIYHNLPYLLKKKGTVEGLRTLINIYGIPNTVLRVNEFGGKDKDNSNDWDYWQNTYNYKLDTSTTESFISTDFDINTLWNSLDDKPNSIQFRFNAGLAANAPASQSLWSLDTGAQAKLVLEYDTTLPTTSGSYSGSIINSGSQYADLKLTIDNFNTSTSVRLPFYNNDWWSVQINRTGANSWELLAANKIYSGSDGSQIGFIASSSVSGVDPAAWSGGTTSYFSTRDGGGITGYSNFTGSYQEIRYFNQAISKSVFEDYVMNPQSIEGNGINGSYNQLVFRAPLGGELYTGSVSIHPKVTGSNITQSFSGNSNFTVNGETYTSNTEYVFFDQVPVGIKNRNTDKIKKSTLVLPTSSSQDNIPNADVLSSFQTVQQNSYVSESYTSDIDYVEVAFSPQNEINDDIIDQLGYFNIGEYIGDPRQISSSNTSYPDLDTLRDAYFEKYTHSYDIWDYVRLIKYLDNSLFKMLKDWVPARTSLASGVVIKQHLLERNKYPTPQLDTHTTTSFQGSGSGTITWNDPFVFQNLEVTGSSIQVGSLSAGPGGSVNDRNTAVGYFRAIATSYPVTSITSTPTILFSAGTITLGTIEDNGVAITEEIDSNGRFVNTSGFDIKGDIQVEIRNNADTETFLLELVRDYVYIDGSVTKEVPQVTAPDVNTLVLKNVTLRSGSTYQFQLSTTTAPAQIVGVVRANFIQYDVPEDYRTGQIYTVTHPTLSGSLTETIVNNHEFYDGEFSGSNITVTDGDLMDCNVDTNLIYTQSGSSLDVQNIDFNINSDDSYYLVIEATNNTGFATAAFNIAETSDLTYRFYTSDQIPIGGTINVTLTINQFTIGDKELRTPYLTFAPAFGAGSGFELTASIYENSISNDCLVLQGNATTERSNTFYYDVDYSNGQILPINKEVILSGSATKATIPDSNFTSKAIINSRYIGKELTAANLNVWTEGDTSYGKSVTIGNPQTYFAYFNWVGGTSPEWGNNINDRTAANIKYYINENGDVIDPINDIEGINVGIARQNFEENKNAIIALDSDDEFGVNLGALNASWPVFKSGYTIAPIIYTQTASYDNNGDVIDFGFTGAIDFVSGDLTPNDTINDVQLLSYGVNFTNIDSGDTFPKKLEFSTPTILGESASFSTSTDQYSPITDNPEDEGITLYFDAKISSTGKPGTVITYAIQKYTGSVWTNVATKTITYTTIGEGNIYYNDPYSKTADEYRVAATAYSGTDTVSVNAASYFRVTQSPSAGTGGCSDFWLTGSGGFQLTASDNTVTGLNNYVGQTQRDISRSGFNPITLPFTVEKGDEIRFEGTETLSFYISSSEVDASGRLVLNLDRAIPANTTTDYFLLRRYIDDPSYIILDVDKPAGPSSGGILKPQYLASRIESNLDTILENLQDKDLI